MEKKLAACVNIVPAVKSMYVRLFCFVCVFSDTINNLFFYMARSRYEWQGKIEEDSEVLLVSLVSPCAAVTTDLLE